MSEAGKKPDENVHLIVAEDQEVVVEHHPEDWIAFVIFWSLAFIVFLQFFTRYVLNNSLAWTEEIAINVLVVVVFMGAAMCVRTSRHIHVDVLYHYLPPAAGKYLSLMVDVIRAGFFAYASWLMWRYVSIVADERMTTVNLPRNWFFYLVFAAFVLMLLRSLQVLVQNYRRGYSVLEHPEKFDTPGA
jgi:TRAP-type C4-dicarboxylate transport system permease small subunit